MMTTKNDKFLVVKSKDEKKVTPPSVPPVDSKLKGKPFNSGGKGNYWKGQRTKAVAQHVHELIRASRSKEECLSSSSATSLTSSMMGSLLSLNTPFPFRFAQFTTLQANSGGVCAFSIAVDPSSSGTNFAEYSTVITLFNQVRVKSFKITIGPVNTPTSLTQTYPGVVAGCLTTLGNPTSSNAVVENADSVMYAWNNFTMAPFNHSLKINPKPVWADVTTPDPGDNIGCPGCIIGYFEGLPISSDAFRVLIEGVYEFRSRT